MQGAVVRTQKETVMQGMVPPTIYAEEPGWGVLFLFF